MKTTIKLTLLFVFISGCASVIPMQSSLSDQTMLMAVNKNLQANYSLSSDISNGKITTVNVQRNGTERSDQMHEYASETAFNNIWSSYFSNKYNNFSRETLNISVNLNNLYLKNTAATSIGSSLLTGNTQYNVEAIASVYVEVEYKGEVFSNEFEVSASDYQETQQTNYGTRSNTNPMQQRAQLLEAVLNRSVVQFDNFVTSILTLED